MSGNEGLVSLVIPVTSQDADVGELLRECSGSLERAGYRHEFVFVLDGVAGQVERELRANADRYPLKIVRLQGGGLGESIALSAGVDRAAGEMIVNIPHYLQAEPDDLDKVIQALENGADFVATWRHPRVDPWLNRLQSRLFNWMLRVLMGITFNDLNSSVRGMRKRVLEEVNVYGELYRFLPVLALRQGFRTVEVKVRHRQEKGQKGFYGIGVYVRRMLDILAITFLTRFTQRPLRFFGMLGLLLIVIGLALCISPIWERVTGMNTSQRPILVLGTVLIAFGVQLIGFGLVGEIIIFTQASNLRDYKIEEDLVETEEFVPDLVPPPVLEGTPLRVREILPGEDAKWDSFVRHHPDGSFYHLSGWRRVIEDVFGHRPRCLVAEHGKQWLGVLPLFWVKSPFLGRNLVSIPYGVYGGILTDRPDVRTGLMEAAKAHGQELGAAYIELRHLVSTESDLPTSELYVTFRKELPEQVDAVMPAIPKKSRAEVRRARDKFGLTFEEFRDLDQFFSLFSLNKRRLGSPSLPRRWFQSLVDEFGSLVVMHVVRDAERRPIAAVMSFSYNDTLCAYYSGSDSRRHKTGVNQFVYCKIMEWAVEKGFRVFDFGRSRRDTGPASFKKHMGFEAEQLHYEYVLLKEEASLPDFHPSNPKLKLPQRVWSRLPPFVADRLGGRLSRYLP
ncbi:MAG: FemAB family XrtA/PEP-CTERM system-associated protein [Planctomycetota bacterium]